ncbi:MAG: NADPH:quinone oxidoreductase family protein [Pseudomonadota bacterium]
MRAVICKALDGPSALAVEETPPPPLVPGSARIAVKAAGLNFADTLMIQGRYQMRLEPPFTPGFEAAGVVREVAPDVRGLEAGDRVIAVPGHGAFAEDIVCAAAELFACPDDMDFVAAAGFPVAYGTAHLGLWRRANLEPGETLLVLGAAGGVGLAAIEVGRAMGATVIAAARGEDKLALARAHGADHAIDYAREDLRQRAKALAGGSVDVVFDPVGGDVFDAALRTLGWEGRIVIVGFAGGRIPQIPANLLLLKNIAATGLHWGDYRRNNPDLMRTSFTRLFAWWREGKLKPHVSHRFDLAAVAAAMDLLLARRSTGKVVLTTDDS